MSMVESEPGDDLRPEYDEATFRHAVRGKYAERDRAGTNLILLEPDVATAFPDSRAVNEALRRLLREFWEDEPE